MRYIKLVPVNDPAAWAIEAEQREDGLWEVWLVKIDSTESMEGVFPNLGAVLRVFARHVEKYPSSLQWDDFAR